VWSRTAGLIGGTNDTYWYKLTASTADGSTASAYNTNGSGYLSTDGKPTSDNYVKQMEFGVWGWLPFEVGAYSTQYYKDYYYNGAGFALVGGASDRDAYCGAFSVRLTYAVSIRTWSFGAAPSCKPCRTGNLNKNLEAATVTPIYIGSEPLDKDEYIDYQAGKIYRMIDGVLTPTDPPVTLPALPTAEGTTIIDYVGQSVAPEKVLLNIKEANSHERKA
jgi:hypothetical protein